MTIAPTDSRPRVDAVEITTAMDPIAPSSGGPTPPRGASVKWGSKHYDIVLIQISPQGIESAVPLSDQELNALIPKIEQALIKMQSINFNPSGVKQIDLRWAGKSKGGGLTNYSFEGAFYTQKNEQVRNKLPLDINALLDTTFPEIKQLNALFSQKASRRRS